MEDLHPPDDYSHRFFIWHEWIQVNGPLTIENVFDYFATSMFYDKQCNNQVLRMQTMHSGQPLVNEAEELRKVSTPTVSAQRTFSVANTCFSSFPLNFSTSRHFTGIEFALVHAQPPSLFIVHKRQRFSPDEVRPLAAYFIVNNRIYQSPDLYSVLSNRLLTTLHSLQSSLDVLRSHRPDFAPRTGFVWPIVESQTGDNLNRKRAGEDASVEGGENAPSASIKAVYPGRASATKKHENNIPLFNAMRTTIAHSVLSFAQQTADEGTQEMSQESSISSGTPVPAREDTPAKVGAQTLVAQDSTTRSTLAVGKKRKKRLSSAPTPGR